MVSLLTGCQHPTLSIDPAAQQLLLESDAAAGKKTQFVAKYTESDNSGSYPSSISGHILRGDIGQTRIGEQVLTGPYKSETLTATSDGKKYQHTELKDGKPNRVLPSETREPTHRRWSILNPLCDGQYWKKEIVRLSSLNDQRRVGYVSIKIKRLPDEQRNAKTFSVVAIYEYHYTPAHTERGSSSGFPTRTSRPEFIFDRVEKIYIGSDKLVYRREVEEICEGQKTAHRSEMTDVREVSSLSRPVISQTDPEGAFAPPPVSYLRVVEIGSPIPRAKIINLTKDGTQDWVRFPGNIRKQRVPILISDAESLDGVGSAYLSTYANDPCTVAWNDGTPIVSGSTTEGITVGGINNGFRIKVAADTKNRSLSILAGGWRSGQKLRAYLSDSSGFAEETGVIYRDLKEQYTAEYSIIFCANSPGKVLTVEIIQTEGDGNITLQGAYLSLIHI